MTRAREFAVNHHVRRCADQRQHAADESGESKRHHQPGWRNVDAPGNAQGHRNEQGDDPGRTHDRTQAGDGQHEQHEQPCFAASGSRQQPVADTVGDAGADQRLANDEEGCDQDDARLTEAGQRLGGSERAGEHQREQRHDRHRVHAWLVHDEGDDAGGEQKKDQEGVGVHARFIAGGKGPVFS